MILKYDHLKYGDRVILQAGEISVPEGCITVVSGESGSGKSTLFRYLERECEILQDFHMPAGSGVYGRADDPGSSGDDSECLSSGQGLFRRCGIA